MEDPKDGSTEYNGPDVGGHRNGPSMVMGFGNGVPRTPQATARVTETRDFQANEGGGEIRRE